MKKHCALIVFFTATSLWVLARQTSTSSLPIAANTYSINHEQGKITKTMLSATQPLSSFLADKCIPALFIVEFILGENGKQTDSVNIIALDSSYQALVDRNKLKKMPVEWSLLVNKPILRKGTRIVQPIMIIEYEENCGPVRISPMEVMEVFTHLQAYSSQLNETAFLLKLMDIKANSIGCHFVIPPIPIAQAGMLTN